MGVSPALSWAVCWHITANKTTSSCSVRGRLCAAEMLQPMPRGQECDVRKPQSMHHGSCTHHKDTVMVHVSLKKY